MESPGSSQRAVTPVGAHIRNLQQQEEQQRSRDSEQANCHIKLDTVGPPGQRTRSIACTAFSTASPSRTIASPNRRAAVRNLWSDRTRWMAALICSAGASLEILMPAPRATTRAALSG